MVDNNLILRVACWGCRRSESSLSNKLKPASWESRRIEGIEKISILWTEDRDGAYFDKKCYETLWRRAILCLVGQELNFITDLILHVKPMEIFQHGSDKNNDRTCAFRYSPNNRLQ